jgi:hypothetical protein
LLPSRVGRRNQALAYQTIRHVRRMMEVRAVENPDARALQVSREAFPSWVLGRFEEVWPIWHESERVQQGETDWPNYTLVHRLARLADVTRGNSAGEQAALAFSYLLSLGIRPLDFMHAPGRDHAFVVIGRDDPVKARAASDEDEERGAVMTAPDAARHELRPETWGVDAVVCDPYHGVVCRQVELLNTEYFHDYYPSESQLRAPVVQEPAFDG